VPHRLRRENRPELQDPGHGLLAAGHRGGRQRLPGVFTNDPYPPSKRLKGVTVEDGAIICAGATLLSGVTVGRRAVVGMGSVVTHDVAPGTVVYGGPASPRYDYAEYLERRRRWEISEGSG